jgi:hypothetical protein
MADVSYSVLFRVDKDNFFNQINVTQVTATQSRGGYRSVVMDLSTAYSSISTANLSSVGLAFLRNLATSSAATVQIGIEAGGSFGSFGTLRGGEPAILRLTPGVDYAAVGVTGSRLRIDIAEG